MSDNALGPQDLPSLLNQLFESRRFLHDANSDHVDNQTLTDQIIASLQASQNRHAFGVYLTAAQASNGLNAFTKLLLDTEEFDPDGVFDVVQHRFTCPESGIYQFHGNGYCSQPGATLFTCAIFKNGVDTRLGTYTISSTNSAHVSSLLKLKQGEYVELYYASSTAGGSFAGSPFTYFNGHMVQSL